MAARLTPAGWCWLAYALGVAAVVASCSGCATTATAAPAQGMRCMLGASMVDVLGPAPMVDGHGRAVAGFAVRHPDPWGAWFVRADQLSRCQA